MVFLNNTDNNEKNQDNTDTGIGTEDSDNNLTGLSFFDGKNNSRYKIISIESVNVVKAIECNFLTGNLLGAAIDCDKALLAMRLLDNDHS